MFIFFLFKTILISSVVAWYEPVVYPQAWEPGYHGFDGVHNGLEDAKHFVNEWTVEVEGGEEIAQLVALELGYAYGGPVRSFPDMYTFLRYEHEKQRRTPSATHTRTLAKDRRVRWAEQVFLKSRVKRYPTPEPDRVVERVKRVPTNGTRARNTRAAEFSRRPLFNDELWNKEWYLDTRNIRNLPRLDLNVLPVYAMGFNGSSVRVSVLDDGIEHNHTDLRANYDPEISWDCNDNDPDPQPRFEEIKKNSHGTRCAGEIAMTANNKKCGVGVAWGAKVGGVRMLDGRITDRIEGEAIGYAWDKVDIYSASWGPNDDGRTVEGPGRLAIEAFKRGITQGRGGKGCIYVWANGNGGGHHDNCNCDGYSSSIYTISIGSASQHGLFPWYGEICSSTLATAYSSGAYKDQKIATTDTKDSCTLGHTGTSAAAPLAAGIIALALQANPNLTWRDVQHLIVWTSEYAPLSSNPGWQINGAGFRFDIRFGFGLLNAGALVATSLNWTSVPEKSICRVKSSSSENNREKLYSKDKLVVPLEVDKSCSVNHIEHVEMIINVQYTRRGALQIYLVSPMGTKVQVLSARPRDASTAGFVDWPLTSVATWGEDPRGLWKAVIVDATDEDNRGEVGSLTLVIHGTKEMPEHMKDGPRKYNDEYNKYDEETTYFDIPESIPGENEALQVPEQYSTEADSLSEIDPTILAEVEKELQRIHHKIYYSSRGV
ncbi:neuroendocrine convertase 1-like isoform X2 [Plodia interpunctella]|uniref:neuroendocrine convertase 1-like isoform X2 n=1 Tax=Plodia interpunctella TaxID=58824 RepID=UPI002368CA88|nr:neuroendocrine convertase 1-like isoform X2 [Plodia interpunctella]